MYYYLTSKISFLENSLKSCKRRIEQDKEFNLEKVKYLNRIILELKNHKGKTMNIDDIKFSDLKKIAEMFNGGNNTAHPLVGKNVVAILPHGFIYFGKLSQESGTFKLTEASNLRHCKQRNGGLPEFAQKGPISDDRIDKISDCVCFDIHIAIVPCGEWNA